MGKATSFMGSMCGFVETLCWACVQNRMLDLNGV